MSVHQHDSLKADKSRKATQSQSLPDGPSLPVRRSGVGRSVWFAIKAIEIRLRFVAVLVGIGLVIGYWDTIRNYWDKWTRPSVAAGDSLSSSEEFYCPMHPSVVRDQPDPGGATPKCPICGMPLSKRQKGEAATLPEGVVSRVQLSPYRVQLAGVQTVEVAHQPLTVDIRAVGYVTIDERRLSRIVVRAAGYVEKLYVNESFAQVSEGEPLAEIYSPELYSTAQELLIARSGTNSQLGEIARQKLRLLGVAQAEIDEILRTGKATPRLVIRSPHGGHVFEKRVVEGDHVDAGQMLFEVADLATVWIEGEVYEKDAATPQNGQMVEATVEAYPGRTFRGRVSLVHPHVETSTRTLRVRFELENPGHMLRPGMFATVWLKTPIQAIEPFRTKLAAQASQFLLTSNPTGGADGVGNDPTEVRLSPDDAPLIAAQMVCPVTGAKLGTMGEPVRIGVGERVVFLCCAGCEEKLVADPDHYVARLFTVTEDGVLTVPEEAVVDTGRQKIVYIEREPGLFEGVVVTLGPRSGGSYAVIDGLLPGDRVAAAGAFLVDAETRLNPAASATYFGASGSSAAAGTTPSSTRNSQTSDGSGGTAARGGFSADEREHLAKLAPVDRKLAEAQGKCPITKQPLGSMGAPVKMVVQGETLFLCCEGCQDQVSRDPAGALAKIKQWKTAP